MSAPIPDVGVLRATAPEALREVIRTALAKSPADRFSSAEGFADAVDRACRPEPRRRPYRGWIPKALTLLLIPIAALFIRGAQTSYDVETTDPERVAVFPFESNSLDSTGNRIAAQLTQGLTRELGRIGAFRVVPIQAIDRWKSLAIAKARVSTDDATLILDGVVDLEGSDVTVRIDLIDVRTGNSLDSLQLRRRLRDGSLEADLIRQVSGALRRELGRKARHARLVTGTASSAAKANMINAEGARQLAASLARESHPMDLVSALSALGRADSLLVQAQTTDSAWLRPLIERAWIAQDRAMLLDGPARIASLESGVRLADQAVHLSPKNAEALAARGTLRWRLVTEFEAAAPDSTRVKLAEADLRAALDADSTLAGARATLAFLLNGNGAYAEAAIAARRALEDDAYLADAPQIYLELFFGDLQREEFDDAHHWCLRGQTEFPGDWRFVQCELTLMRHDTRRVPDPAKAWALVDSLERLDPAAKAWTSGRKYQVVFRPLAAATISARAGDRGRGIAELEKARRIAAANPGMDLDLAYDEAYLLLVLGQRPQATALLRKLIAARSVLGPLLERDPLFRGLELH